MKDTPEPLKGYVSDTIRRKIANEYIMINNVKCFTKVKEEANVRRTTIRKPEKIIKN